MQENNRLKCFQTTKRRKLVRLHYYIYTTTNYLNYELDIYIYICTHNTHTYGISKTKHLGSYCKGKTFNFM